MRILMLAQFYTPIIGGEERLVQDLSVELAGRGHQVAVATLWHDGLAKFELDRGVQIYRIPSSVHRAGWLFSEPGRRHAPPWPDPEAVFALGKVLRHHRPEIVHAHNWLVYSFLPLKPASKARLVVTLHDYSMACANKRLMRHGTQCAGPSLLKCTACTRGYYGSAKGPPTLAGNWLMAAIERAAVDMFLPISQSVAAGNGLVGRGWPYQIIPNFVPDTLGPAQPSDPAFAAQLPPEGYWLFVGDITADKGVDVLLRAYAGMAGVPPLVLIGRRHASKALTLPPNVVVLESWPHSAVMEAWRRCSLALVPSLWAEPFGLVALEAMAAGCPVIASCTGGLCDIVVDGETGLLVPPGDPVALRAAITKLCASPELRERMGQAGQRKVAEYRASSVVPRFEQVYRAILGHNQSIGRHPVAPVEPRVP
jgi:glycosyltransferase involved in cell wall biosynthesis